jgi:hypothetical protein
MALQIRVAATCRLVNRCTGSTPGRLFQISTNRAPGHLAASLSSSCGLLNVSLPFSLAFICGEEPETLILFSVSIVNAVIKFLSEFSLIDDIHPSCRRHKQANSTPAQAKSRGSK